MTVVRKSNDKTTDGRYFVEAYHQRAEVLNEDQREGTIEVSSIPAKPERAGYTYRLVIDDANNLDWMEFKKDTPELEELVKLVSKGEITLEQLEDEEVTRQISDRI